MKEKISILYTLIEKIIEKENISKQKIAQHVKLLSDKFNNFNASKNTYMENQLSRIAYLAYFYPINVYKFLHIISFYENYFSGNNNYYFDFGAGPLTFYTALCLLKKDGKVFYTFDKNYEIMELGKKIITMLNKNFSDKIILKEPQKPINVLILSNVITEITQNERVELIKNLINRLDKKNCIIVVLEPGTKKGFENIKLLKEFLLNFNFSDLTFCPYSKCPLINNEWCHENLYFPRSTLIQYIEDKTGLNNRFINFTYAILSTDKKPLLVFQDNTFRVVSNLLVRKGDYALYLCGKNGINQYTILKRHINEKNSIIKSLRRGDIIEVSNYTKISTGYRLDINSTIRILKKFS
jgi:ribosomal protein RSM22 (predicted rRNA methylase)